jgi:hypothetical protein
VSVVKAKSEGGTRQVLGRLARECRSVEKTGSDMRDLWQHTATAWKVLAALAVVTLISMGPIGLFLALGLGILFHLVVDILPIYCFHFVNAAKTQASRLCDQRVDETTDRLEGELAPVAAQHGEQLESLEVRTAVAEADSSAALAADLADHYPLLIGRRDSRSSCAALARMVLGVWPHSAAA